MKLSLDIELDWVDEESNLDETVKQNVIDAVVNKIQKNVETKVEGKINEIIDKTIISKINTLTENIFNDFMNKQITLSDNYGSAIKVYNNVYEIIKERFDNFMEQTVDEKGQTYTGSYGTKYKRITFIIDNQLQAFAAKFTTDAVKQVSEEIKQHVKDGLTNKLGAELMKVLKVNDMLQLTNGKS